MGLFSTIGGELSKFGGNASKWGQTAVTDVGKWGQTAVGDTAKWGMKAGADVGRWGKQAGADIGATAGMVLKDAEKAIAGVTAPFEALGGLLKYAPYLLAGVGVVLLIK